jgi:hypothetical protein
MARSSSDIRARREALVQEVEAVTGLKMKRASYSTTTGGLSCSNENKLLNGFAHLLCNEKNFPTVRWALYNEVAIPLEFQENFNRASFLYACGTAPRIILKGSRHVSKDAVKSGKGQEFVQWAQAQRIAGVGGLAGLSRSVERAAGLKGVVRFNQFGELEEVFTDPLDGEDFVEESQQDIAANQQLAMRKVSESVGQSAFQKAVNKQGQSAMTRVKQLIAAMKAAHAPAPKKSAPVTEVAEEVEAAAATGTGGKKKRGGKKAAATVTLID